MADPTPYTPGFSFSDFQSNSPTTPLPAPQVDNELDNIAAAVAALVSSLKDVRRSDGALKNNIVTFASLELGLQLTFDPTNGELVAAAILGAEASAAAALASATAAANSAAAALTQALAAAASASSVNLNAFLTKAGNLASLGSLVTSRSNLGLGSVATFDVGGAAYNIVQLDGGAKLPAYDGSHLTNIDVLPVGAVVYTFTGSAVPGTVKLNGALLSRASFPRLWAHASSGSAAATSEAGWSANPAQFSTGDLATTFRIPDVRGEFVRNWDDGRGVDTGRGLGGIQTDTLKDHAHPYGPASTVTGVDRTGAGAFPIYWAGAVSNSLTTGSPSTGAASETRPRNIPMLACIKY